MEQQEKQAMTAYYAQRAASYDELYLRPQRQGDLAQLKRDLQAALQAGAARKVVELACGTGYWTAELARQVEQVLAFDINDSMLQVARSRLAGCDDMKAVVDLQNCDIWALPDLRQEQAQSVVAGFWWSHVKRAEQGSFLQKLRQALGPCQLILFDNCYVEGESTSIARTDADGNTYQLRPQEDGSRVEILKNFPTDSNLRKKFSDFARDIRITRSQYYWMLVCRLK